MADKRRLKLLDVIMLQNWSWIFEEDNSEPCLEQKGHSLPTSKLTKTSSQWWNMVEEAWWFVLAALFTKISFRIMSEYLPTSMSWVMQQDNEHKHGAGFIFCFLLFCCFCINGVMFTKHFEAFWLNCRDPCGENPVTAVSHNCKKLKVKNKSKHVSEFEVTLYLLL